MAHCSAITSTVSDSLLNHVMSKLFNFSQINSVNCSLETSTKEQIRARVAPKTANQSCIFAPDTVSWLRSCAINNLADNPGSLIVVYIVPLLGITNRPLAGYRKAGLNLFKTLVKISIPTNVRNFNQCTIEFGSRIPISNKAFYHEIYRQMSFTNTRIKTKGRLSFYGHGQASIAAITDLEALRQCALKSMPIINIDWLDSSSTWEKLWNPCAALAPVKAKLEGKLIALMDKIVEQLCASQCNAIIKSTDGFIDSTYLPHRQHKKLPGLNKTIYLPSINQTDKSVDPLDAEYNLLNYLSSNIRNGRRGRFGTKQKPDEEGWMPVGI